jgi:tetratricopeptide (TPR) repeat protein
VANIEEAKRLYDKGLDGYRAGEYEEALEALTRARDLYAEAGDRNNESAVLNDMGVVCVQMEDEDNAKRFLEEALTIRMVLQDRSGQGMTLGNLGMMYARQDETEKATEAYQQAIAIFQELDDKGNEKAVARQLSKLSGAPTLAHRLFRLLGRLTGGHDEESPADEETDEGEEAS